MSRSRAVYIGLNELAARWGVNPRTVYRWLAKGTIADTGIPFTHSRVGHRYAWSDQQLADLEYAMAERGISA